MTNSILAIETAPRDGSVILTDEGFARYIDQNHWASPVENGWAQCSPNGTLFDDAENGFWYCEPKQWQPIPDWINR